MRSQLVVLLIGFAFASIFTSIPRAQNEPLGFSFTNVGQKAGLNARVEYGGRETNKYLLETTGTGIAANRPAVFTNGNAS